jgi:type IX secretion system PorP/SprF family membrane protein
MLTLKTMGLQAQDPVVSQFFSNKLYFNPSLTGYEEGTLFHLNYRRQNYLISGQRIEFTSNALGLQLDLPCVQSAVGFLYLDNIEAEGYLQWQSISTAYSWRSRSRPDRQGRDNEWRFGMRLAYNWRSLNWNNLVFDEEIDAVRGIMGPTNLPLPGDLRTNTDYFDLQTGLSWVYRKGENRLRVGASLHHLLRVEQTVLAADDTLPLRTTLHLSFLKNVNWKGAPLHFMPFVRLDLQKGGTLSLREAFYYQSLSYGLMVNTQSLPAVWGGVWLRSYQSFPSQPPTNSLIVSVGFEFPNRAPYEKARSIYRFGLSYDYPFSGLAAGGSNIFEVSLAIHFPTMGFRSCEDEGKRYMPAVKF